MLKKIYNSNCNIFIKYVKYFDNDFYFFLKFIVLCLTQECDYYGYVKKEISRLAKNYCTSSNHTKKLYAFLLFPLIMGLIFLPLMLGIDDNTYIHIILAWAYIFFHLMTYLIAVLLTSQNISLNIIGINACIFLILYYQALNLPSLYH